METGLVRIRLGHHIEPLEDWINFDLDPIREKVLPWNWGEPFVIAESIPDSTVDVIFLDWVLHKCPHEPNERLFYGLLSECWRVLMPGGTVVVETPYGASPEVWADPAVARVIVPETFDHVAQQAAGWFEFAWDMSNPGRLLVNMWKWVAHVAVPAPVDAPEGETLAVQVKKNRRPRRHGHRKGVKQNAGAKAQAG